MKLESKGVTNVVYGDVEQRQFGIAMGGKIFDILSDKLYSDKILAPIRELVCNARDAQVAAGNGDGKFIVHLPNKLEPYFSVRDFGPGLSHQEILDIYTVYGLTTKDNTNTAIGCLGLGSKSPFAYTDMFEIYSYKDGTLNVYQCAREEAAPTVTKFSTSETDEPNGLEVRFNVNSYDFYDFEKRLASLFFLQKYMDVKGAETDFPDIPSIVSGNVYELLDQCTSGINSQLSVEMGGVLYRVDTVQDKGAMWNFTCKLPTGKRAIIHADIGAVDVTISREQVEMTEKSRNFINKVLKDYMDKIQQQVIDEVATEPNVFMRLMRYKVLLDKTGAFGHVARLDRWYIYLKNFVQRRMNVVSLIPGKRGVNKYAFANTFNWAEEFPSKAVDSRWPIFVDCTKKQVTPTELRVLCNKRNEVILCVKDVDTLKVLKRYKVPVHSLEEYAMYKPVRPKTSYKRSKSASSSEPGGKHLIVAGLSTSAFDYYSMNDIRKIYSEGGTIWWCEKGKERVMRDGARAFLSSLSFSAIGGFWNAIWPYITSIVSRARCDCQLPAVTVCGDSAIKRVKSDPQFRSIEDELKAAVIDKKGSRGIAVEIIEDILGWWLCRFSCYSDSFRKLLYERLKYQYTNGIGVEVLPYARRLFWRDAEETRTSVNTGTTDPARCIRKAAIKSMIKSAVESVARDYKRTISAYIEDTFPLLVGYLDKRCHEFPDWDNYPAEVKEDLEEYINKVIRRIKKARSTKVENNSSNN